MIKWNIGSMFNSNEAVSVSFIIILSKR